jgi:toxin ParE1/3/4
MAYQVGWSPEAVEDVEEIAGYIGKDSPQYAQAVADRLVAYSRRLNDSPLRGRVVPELNDPSYRMIYRVEDSGVLIIAVIHGKRLLTSIADRFDDEL